MDPEDVCRALNTPREGLSSEEVQTRLKEYGPNTIAEERNISGIRIFISQFTSPLVLILIGASLISFFLGERTQTTIIIGMIGLGGFLGFYQEYRSEKALRSLRRQLGHQAIVHRDGQTITLEARNLVPGDIVEFELGSIIPADLRLLRADDLEVDESSLTGESEPVAKSIGNIAATHTTPQELSCIAFAGTHVVQGSGCGIVIATAGQTSVGQTASLLNQKADETSFQKGLKDFGNFLLKITFVLALAVFILIGAIRGDWTGALLFALALAVGISPELLPVIVTINLSRGALAMGKKHVLIKRLSAIEDLGNANIFCTDKTGTLTVGKIRVRNSVDSNGKDNKLPLELAAQCLDIDTRGRASNSIDAAILDAHRDQGSNKLIDLISFDFQRRRMSCVREIDGKREIITKGAVNEILAACTHRHVYEKGLKQSLDEKTRKQILAMADHFHDEGYRAVAVSRRSIEAQETYSPADEHDLEFMGLVLVSDAPKETAALAITQLENLGTRIIILTGDNERVTRHVAEQLNFIITRIMTGDEIDKMDDVELQAATKATNVFARITPTHKLRIVKAFRAAGHIVGFMGDGVNDAPALRAADVGISFQDATDVAKEAAAVILLRKNLSVLAEGIREGRRTFINTRTYLRATIASNFGNMLSVAGAALLLPFIPLLPAQILLLNLLTDLPMLAISTDNVSDEDLKKPKHWDIREISNFMYFFGSISSLADYATFALLLFVAQANMQTFRSGWFIESAFTEIVVIFLLRSRGRSWKNKPSLPLVISAIITLFLPILFTQTKLGTHFGLVPLSPKWILILITIVAAYAGLTELGKGTYQKLKAKSA